MAKKSVIQFSNIWGKLMGVWTVNDDGTSEYSTPAVEGIITGYLDDGVPVPELIDRFSDWSNGYVTSESLMD